MGEKNIMVLDGGAEIVNYYEKPATVSTFSITICHSGYLDVEYDSRKRRFQSHYFVVLYPHHIVMAMNPSPDYRFTKVLISSNQLNRMAVLNMNIQRFSIEREPQCPLSESQYSAVMDALNTLRHVLSIQSPMSELMSDYALMVLFGLLDTYKQANEGDLSQRKTYISPRLYEAVMENCHRHHDVDFYAKKFCLSPKHFSTVVRQETGMPAAHWIHQIIVFKAKIVLQYEPAATIQDISYRLGFKDQTSFSRYFKRETGLTPSEYRQMVKAGSSIKR